MNERLDIDVGYDDPWDRRDPGPDERPSPAELADDGVQLRETEIVRCDEARDLKRERDGWYPP